MADLELLEGAEEFALGDGPVGALLLHGFTGCPQSLRPVGEYLADRGIAVEGIRLPGHGTTWEDLNTRRSEEWIAAVDAGFEKITRGRDKVFVVGLSFGGTLMLDLAARRPDKIAGLVSIAGFAGYTKDPKRFLAPFASRFISSLPGLGNDIADPDGREVCYDRIPAKAAVQMLRLARQTKSKLPAITAPILILQSRNDHTVDPRNANLIYDSVSSTDKDIVWFDRSFHVLTLDYDRDAVYEKAYEFIKERADAV